MNRQQRIEDILMEFYKQKSSAHPSVGSPINTAIQALDALMDTEYNRGVNDLADLVRKIADKSVGEGLEQLNKGEQE